MQHLELTTISKLQIGDRFYKKTDRKKVKYTKVLHAAKETPYYTYTNWAKADGNVAVLAFKFDSPVIFLRSTATQNV